MNAASYAHTAMQRMEQLGPHWLGAAAGAAAAGAVVWPAHRALAAAGAAAVVIALGLYAQRGHGPTAAAEPCCQGCADGHGCEGTAPAPVADAPAAGAGLQYLNSVYASANARGSKCG